MRVAPILPAILLWSLSVYGQTPASTVKLPGDLRLMPSYAQSLQKKDPAKPEPTKAAKLQTGAVQEAPACAHIQIHLTSPNIDPKIALPATAGVAAAMPTMKALPACAAPAAP